MLAKRKAEPKGIHGSWSLLSGNAGAGVPSEISSFWSEQAKHSLGTPGKGFARPEWWRVGRTQAAAVQLVRRSLHRASPASVPAALLKLLTSRAAGARDPRGANQPPHAVAVVPKRGATRLPGTRSRVRSGPRRA